jgi:hypothetical protein
MPYSNLIAWADKDNLPSGSAEKIISGADFNTEFSNIVTAINSKADTNGNASNAFSAATAATGTNNNQVATTAYVQDEVGNFNTQAQILLAAYPVGAVYITVVDTNPGTLFGGTWSSFATGRTLVGLDSSDSQFDTIEETGGANTHTLTEAEMPEHKHLSPNKDCQSYGGVYGTGTGTVNTWCDTNGISTNNTDAPYGQPVGGDGAHNNLQPYITVYMWKRTA